MNITFIDTETTGMWQFKLPHTDDQQPHLIQLAAIFDDGDGEPDEFETLVQVDASVRIEEGALAVHGITAIRSHTEGVSLIIALTKLQDFLSKSKLIVCHNTSFDLKVLAASYARAGLISFMPTMLTFCTMKKATDVCRVPGKGRGYKWPTLDEAYRILVDPDGFIGAHDALNDVRACRQVYYALKGQRRLNEP